MRCRIFLECIHKKLDANCFPFWLLLSSCESESAWRYANAMNNEICIIVTSREATAYVSEIINSIGQESARAQGLNQPVTTSDRLRNSDDQFVYLLTEENDKKWVGKCLCVLSAFRYHQSLSKNFISQNVPLLQRFLIFLKGLLINYENISIYYRVLKIRLMPNYDTTHSATPKNYVMIVITTYIQYANNRWENYALIKNSGLERLQFVFVEPTRRLYFDTTCVSDLWVAKEIKRTSDRSDKNSFTILLLVHSSIIVAGVINFSALLNTQFFSLSEEKKSLRARVTISSSNP